MKKIVALLLTIAAVLPILTSCAPTETAPEDNDDTEYMTPDITVSPDDTTDEDFDPYHDEYGFVIFAPGDYLTDRKFDTDEYLPGYDADNAFIAHGNPENGGICSTDDKIYYFSEVYDKIENLVVKETHTVLMYRDKATGDVGPLCQKPECDHKGKDCDAYFAPNISDLHGLFMYDGKIHWSTDTNVNSIDPVSGEKDKVVTVTKGMFGKGDFYSNNSTETAVPHRGYVYYAGKRSVNTGYAGGTGNAIYEYTLTVGAAPIDGGEDTFIIFERKVPEGSSCNLRFVGNDVYIMIAEQNTQGMFHYFDYEGIYLNVPFEEELSESSVELYRWDSKTRKAEMLYKGSLMLSGDGEYIDVRNGFAVTDDGIYMYTAYNTYDEGAYFRRGIVKYSFDTRALEQPMWAHDNMFIIPCYNDDRIYAYSSGKIVMLDSDGEPIGEAADNTWGNSSELAGADDDYMYFASSSNGYAAVPLHGGESIKLNEGE